MPKIFQLAVYTPVAFIFAEKHEERTQIRNVLRPVAEATRAEMSWVSVDPIEHFDIASEVIEDGKWPAFAIVDGETNKTYALSHRGSFEQLNEVEVQQFVQDFLRDKLTVTGNEEDTPQIEISVEAPTSSSLHDEL